LPLARDDDADFDVAPLEDADLDDEDFDAAVFDVAGFARDEAEPFDEPDRRAGVLFLDDPQLDMSPPPYQPGVTPRRDPLLPRGAADPGQTGSTLWMAPSGPTTISSTPPASERANTT